MMKKLLFVYNPHAGKGRIGAQLDKIVSAFDKEDYEVTLRPTRGKGDATRIFRENAGLYDRFLVSGGDGTLNEAVSGLIAAAEEGISIPELGYLPAGSTNDFASSLKIPTQIPKAIQVAARGTPFPCDAGSLNGTPYVYVAAFGAFTEVSYATPQQTKNALGHLAYILEGVRSLPQIKGIPMEVTVNGVTMEDRFLYGMVSNTTSVGGFRVPLAQQKIQLDDGMLEVLLVREAKNLTEQTELISALLRMDLSSPYLFTARAPEVRFLSTQAVAWTTDGEFGGEFREAEVKVLRRAYTILVPQQSDGALRRTQNEA